MNASQGETIKKAEYYVNPRIHEDERKEKENRRRSKKEKRITSTKLLAAVLARQA
jgi:hypothetical protein